jgi:hypothetical protein
MTTSSLVITLRPEVPAEDAMQLLVKIPGLSVGVRRGLHVPAVLEAASLAASRRVVEELPEELGIAFVALVAVDFEDEVT